MLMRCIESYQMDNGTVAFERGANYRCRMATEDERVSSQCEYVFLTSELPGDHYLPVHDVARYFYNIPTKRTIEARVDLVVFVELEIEDEEQITADPDGEISDGEAAEMAINTAIKNCDVFVFGPEHSPAQVHIDSIDIDIEGECQDE